MRNNVFQSERYFSANIWQNLKNHFLWPGEKENPPHIYILKLMKFEAQVK